jgi:hypothetical protein
LPHWAALGKGLGHDGQKFDTLVKDVVHLEKFAGFRIRSEIVMVAIPIHTIPGHDISIPGNRFESLFSHGIISRKCFGHNDEESESGKKDMIVLDLFHGLTGCAESLHSQFRGLKAVEVEDEITIK